MIAPNLCTNFRNIIIRPYYNKCKFDVNLEKYRDFTQILSTIFLVLILLAISYKNRWSIDILRQFFTKNMCKKSAGASICYIVQKMFADLHPFWDFCHTKNSFVLFSFFPMSTKTKRGKSHIIGAKAWFFNAKNTSLHYIAKNKFEVCVNTCMKFCHFFQVCNFSL